MLTNSSLSRTLRMRVPSQPVLACSSPESTDPFDHQPPHAARYVLHRYDPNCPSGYDPPMHSRPACPPARSSPVRIRIPHRTARRQQATHSTCSTPAPRLPPQQPSTRHVHRLHIYQAPLRPIPHASARGGSSQRDAPRASASRASPCISCNSLDARLRLHGRDA